VALAFTPVSTSATAPTSGSARGRSVGPWVILATVGPADAIRPRIPGSPGRQTVARTVTPMADHTSAEHRTDAQRTLASSNPPSATPPTEAGPRLRPIPEAGLIVGSTDHDQAHPPGGGRVSRTLLPRPTIEGVIRRSKLDYKAGYDQGYLQPPGRWDAQGFDSGLLDGLNELVTDGLIDRQAVRQITQNHPRIIQYPTGWDNDFDLYASASEQQQDGMTAGQGMGFDQGYEEALARYGYSR